MAQVLGLEGAPPAFPRWIFEGRSYEQIVEDVKREYLQLFERHGGDLTIAREMKTTKRNAFRLNRRNQADGPAGGEGMTSTESRREIHARVFDARNADLLGMVPWPRPHVA